VTPDPILKPELEAQDIPRPTQEAPLPHEIDGSVLVEIEGQRTRAFEMTAREEVAAEITDEGQPAELHGESAKRKRFSWEPEEEKEDEWISPSEGESTWFSRDKEEY